MSTPPGSGPSTVPDEQLLALVASSRNGVLATLRRDGRPQLSNITYHYEPDTRLVRISVTAQRAKARNAARDRRVSLHVTSDDFWAWTVVDGDAQLTPPAASPDDEAVTALVALYRAVSGEHPDWEEYRAVMVADHRQVLSFTVGHVYGQPRR